jgi:hypothetical protein
VAVGAKRGLIRPAPMMLVSQRFRSALIEQGAKGYVLEVAHLHQRD